MSVNNYDSLGDGDKLSLAIDCVARGVPIPEPLRLFLLEHDLLEAVEAKRVNVSSD